MWRLSTGQKLQSINLLDDAVQMEVVESVTEVKQIVVYYSNRNVRFFSYEYGSLNSLVQVKSIQNTQSFAADF